MLLDDIIAILSDSKGSLTDALLKTKVLLYQIGKKDLVPWVTSELTGYPDDAEVPPYRIVGSEVRGHVHGFAFDAPDYALPVQHLKPETRKDLQSSKIQMSIESIEQSVQSYRAKGGGLRRNMPTEFGALFQKVLTSGTNVWSSWCAINMVEVENILSEVRSRLLDFALELKDALGDVPQQDLLQKANEVHAGRIFTQAIYNTGSGTIVLGNQNIQVNNQQGDIEGLLKEVAKLGYDQKELEELRQAVTEDKGKNETPSVTNGETGKWYVKALKKVGKGAVNAGIEVVTGVIVKALEHYTKGA